METLATGYGLIEGPVWDADRGLIYSDVINGGVFCLAPDGAISPVSARPRSIGAKKLP